MSLDVTGILAAVQSHALASGLFERVNGHEPKNAPGNGLTAAVWVQRVRPAQGASGLASTSGVLEVQLRIYSNMLAEPQDGIDPKVTEVTDALLTAYSGDFDLGGRVRDVDLLGEFGDGLSAEAGYVEQDHKMFRVVTITIPLVINDLWGQTP